MHQRRWQSLYFGQVANRVFWCLSVKQVQWKVNVHRARCAIHRNSDSAFDHNRYMLDARGPCCILSHWFGARKLVKLLEATHSLLIGVARAAKLDHGSLVDHGLSHTTDAIGQAWAADCQADTWPLSQVADHTGCVGGRRLHSEAEVVHVVGLEGHAQLDDGHAYDSEDVRAALEGECLGHDVVAVYH